MRDLFERLKARNAFMIATYGTIPTDKAIFNKACDEFAMKEAEENRKRLEEEASINKPEDMMAMADSLIKSSRQK